MLTAAVVLAGLILVTMLTGAAAVAVVFLKVRSTLTAFVTPAAEGELSPLAQVTNALGQDFARSLMLQLKQQLSAPATHMARQENALVQDLTQAGIEESAPQWGALLGLLPKNVQKRVLGNPAAAAALVGLLGRFSGGGGGGSAGGSPGNGTKSSVQLRLQNLR